MPAAARAASRPSPAPRRRDRPGSCPTARREVEADNDFVVVMNPFARQAVFSLALLSERQEPVRHSDLTDVVLKPFRSASFKLNDVVLGERTVSTLLEVVGRSRRGRDARRLGRRVGSGRRSGTSANHRRRSTFPGGDDAGRSDLAVMNAGAESDGAGRGDADGGHRRRRGSSSRSPAWRTRACRAVRRGRSRRRRREPRPSRSPPSGPGVAAVRRTFGVASDQAAVTSGVPAPSWIVPPAVAGSPNVPGLVLSNPGTEPAIVTLRFLSPGPADETTVTVAPGTTVQAPQAFVRAAPEAAVLATASSERSSPAAASYSLGREGVATYAVALGIPRSPGSVVGSSGGSRGIPSVDRAFLCGERGRYHDVCRGNPGRSVKTWPERNIARAPGHG